MSFLGLTDKTFLVVGVANKKSVAWAVARLLEEEGARVLYSVRSQKRKEELSKLLSGRKIIVCDFEDEKQIVDLGRSVEDFCGNSLDGILHSIAFAKIGRAHV